MTGDWYIWACIAGAGGLVAVAIGWALERLGWFPDRGPIVISDFYGQPQPSFDASLKAMVGTYCSVNGAPYVVTAYKDGTLSLESAPGTVQNPSDPSPKPRQKRRAFA